LGDTLIIANRLYAFHDLTGEVSPAGRILSELRFCVGAVRERRKRFEVRGEGLEAEVKIPKSKIQMTMSWLVEEVSAERKNEP
jgi:hypothetical protein